MREIRSITHRFQLTRSDILAFDIQFRLEREKYMDQKGSIYVTWSRLGHAPLGERERSLSRQERTIAASARRASQPVGTARRTPENGLSKLNQFQNKRFEDVRLWKLIFRGEFFCPRPGTGGSS